MADYLTLSQDYAIECGISEDGTDPSAVTSQTGELLQAVRNIKQSWLDIQNRHTDWRWMRRSFTVNTTASDDSYAYTDVTDVDAGVEISRFARWLFDDPDKPARCYLTSEGVGAEYWLNWAPWDYFQRIYKIGTQNDGKPAHISIDPQNNLVLGPAPDAVYTVTGDFMRGAQTLAANADTPDMPDRFHPLIVYYAMEHYGYFEAAIEVVQRAEKMSGRLMRQLENDQLPKVKLGAPMC